MSPWLLLLIAQASTETPATEPGVEPLPDLPQPALTEPLASTPDIAPSKTLQDLLDAADKQNVDRRITRAQHDRADAEYRQAWTALLPGLTVSGGWTHNEVTAELPAGTFSRPDPTDPTDMTPLIPAEPITIIAADQLDLAARIDLPIIDTNKWMRASAAGALQDSAAAREQLTADQVRRAVSTAWYGYAGALALKAAAERSVSVAEAQLKLQEIRFRAGAIPELDLFRARAEIERNRQTVADTVRLIAISRRNLTSLTGVDPGEAARLPEPDLRPAGSLQELAANIDQLPAVKAADSDLTAADRVALAAKLALVPIIGAQFTERVSNAAGFGGQAASYNLGLNLTWRLDVPIFMGMQVQSAQASVAALAAEKARLQALDQLNVDLETVRAATAKIGAVKSQVESAQKARAVASTRYQVGASTQIEVIQADRDLFAAEAQQIQAHSDLASARVSLAISAGQPIEAK
jgi:outer membrane protein TolC